MPFTAFRACNRERPEVRIVGRRVLCVVLFAAGPGCGSQPAAGSAGDPGDSSSTSAATSDPTTAEGAGSSGETVFDSDSGLTADGSGASNESTSTGEQNPTGSDGSTSEPIAVCGNGILEAHGSIPEECDDGNLAAEDGCSDTCALDRRVFVTSVLYMGGDLKSLKQADARCANLADDQGWPYGLQYRAWLSDSTTDARDRFTRGRGRLVMANGLVLATSWSALLAGQLENPFEVTEKSETYQGGVWTGTRPDGTAVPDAEHCEDWATESVLPRGYFGYSDRATGEWTLAMDPDQPINCNVEFALYCFQDL